MNKKCDTRFAFNTVFIYRYLIVICNWRIDVSNLEFRIAGLEIFEFSKIAPFVACENFTDRMSKCAAKENTHTHSLWCCFFKKIFFLRRGSFTRVATPAPP